MYRLTQSRSLRQLLTEQLPTLIGAMAMAEAFYKFHSFVLECVAFLATWFVLDWVLAAVAKRLEPSLPECDPKQE